VTAVSGRRAAAVRGASAPAPPGVGGALAAAAGGLYRNSWRFVVANAALSAAVLVPVWLAVATAVVAPLLLVPLLAGPALAGLVHCAVRLAQGDSGEIRVADFGAGVRRHWRRGLTLGVLVALVLVAGAVAVREYAVRGGPFLLLAFACAYVLAAVVLFQLVLWPVAVLRADRTLRAAAAEALAVFLARWPAVLALGLGLLLVNLVGTAAVLPVLTFTVAFSFLAAAHLVLPPPDPLLEV
jgi:hypothetical protein